MYFPKRSVHQIVYLTWNIYCLFLNVNAYFQEFNIYQFGARNKFYLLLYAKGSRVKL